MNSKAMMLILLLLCSTAEAGVVLEPQARDFGYMLGDEVTLTTLIDEDGGYRLDRNSIPQPGVLNEWLVLKDVRLEKRHTAHDYRLQLTYQLFKSVRDTVPLTIPELPLTFTHGSDTRQQMIPAWTFYYSPLLPEALADSEIRLQPAEVPQLLDSSQQQRVLYLLLGGIALLVAYLAWIYDRLPFVRRYVGPFGTACRTIEYLHKHDDANSHRLAMQALHKAVNVTAGETVFCSTLDDFFQNHPAFRSLEQSMKQLYRRSERLFFTDHAVVDDAEALAEILEMCRACRKIERSSRWL